MRTSRSVVAFFLLAAPLLAQAGSITTYSDLASFSSVLGATPTTVETFTDDIHFPITSGVLNSMTNEAGITPGMIQPGVTYSTPISSGNFFNIDCCSATGPFLDSVSGGNPLTVTFDHNTQAFGFDSGLYNYGMDVTINFASGPAYHVSYSTIAAFEFFGFISTSNDIQSVTIGGGTGIFTYAVDNFRFTTAVPEPETYAMLLAGMGLVGFAARRRKKA